MLFKCKDGFVLREDKVYYIKLCEEGYALVYMSYDKETPYTINLEDYFSLATSILKKNENFYITHNGDIFNVKNIMIMGFDDENNYYFNDPYAGKTVKYEKTTVEDRYAELGRQSVVVLDK